MALGRDIARNMLIDNIHQAMDHGKLTGVLFIDLQKAYYTVDHSIIRKRLPFMDSMVQNFPGLKAILRTDTNMFSMAFRSHHVN